LYSITDLGRDLGVSARTIRFYEDKGLIAPRRAGNNRVYSVRDRARMILILRGKKLGFSLREIKEYLDLYDADPTHATQIRRLLTAARARMALLNEQQAALTQAVAELQDIESQAVAALSELERPRRAKTERLVTVAGSDSSGERTRSERATTESVVDDQWA
jgi:DNA-binding transcriptional MerR regulator